jgi:hypothetical protein
MMKKLLYLFLLTPFFGVAQTNVYNYGFDGVTADLATAGWSQVNVSSPVGASTYLIPTAANTAFVGGGNTGGTNSYILVNYNSTTGAGTISNWLFTPVVTVQNGDVVSFYTRKGGDGTTTIYPDNLQFRMSTNGAFTADPTTVSSVGDYSNLLVEVNPALNDTDYPFTWTQYSYTVTGLSGATDVKFAFRYYVTSGGPSGNNSDIIGIDDFSVDRPTASTQDFFASNFSIQPNPVKDIFTLTAKNNTAIENIKVIDINGRIVNELNVSGADNAQVNIADLNAGVYFVKVQTEAGVGTSKIIKK